MERGRTVTSVAASEPVGFYMDNGTRTSTLGKRPWASSVTKTTFAKIRERIANPDDPLYTTGEYSREEDENTAIAEASGIGFPRNVARSAGAFENYVDEVEKQVPDVSALRGRLNLPPEEPLGTRSRSYDYIYHKDNNSNPLDWETASDE